MNFARPESNKQQQGELLNVALFPRSVLWTDSGEAELIASGIHRFGTKDLQLNRSLQELGQVKRSLNYSSKFGTIQSYGFGRSDLVF